MSDTPNLSAFNKDKVANKFGIQLKNKDKNKQSQQTLSLSTEKKINNTETSIVTKNKTVSDFRIQNQLNGFQSNTEPSLKSKSNIELISTSTNNDRRNSFNLNVNHSDCLNTNQSIKSNSQSTLNISFPSKSFDTTKRSSLTPMDRKKSPESSSIKRTNITKTTEHPLSSSKQASIPTHIIKTEAQIELQKDQPLYKRQLSKTLENATSMGNKIKHQHELTTLSNKR
jgi:hypothetical protein